MRRGFSDADEAPAVTEADTKKAETLGGAGEIISQVCIPTTAAPRRHSDGESRHFVVIVTQTYRGRPGRRAVVSAFVDDDEHWLDRD